LPGGNSQGSDFQTGGFPADNGEQGAARAGVHPAANPPALSQPVAPSSGFSNDADRFGRITDEIDTTPQAHPVSKPGAPSAPVWSLKDDIPDTTPREEPVKPEAAKPAKKGWWQRTFSGG
jgi:hypothetical protein